MSSNNRSKVTYHGIGEAIGSFRFQLPLERKYDKIIESFKEKHESYFEKINPKITDIDFANISDKLVPGEVYCGEFYPLIDEISTRDCQDFLLAKDSLFTGPQGLAVLWELAKDTLPEGKYIISLDYNDRVVKKTVEQCFHLLIIYQVNKMNSNY